MSKSPLAPMDQEIARLRSEREEIDKLIAAKKTKFLERASIFLSEAKPPEKSSEDLMRQKISPGVNINRSNASFTAISEEEKEKSFLLKSEEDPIMVTISTDFMRILSAKKFAGKRSALFHNLEEGAIKVAVKWDSGLEGEWDSVNGTDLFSTSTEGNEIFLSGFSRMAGTLAVLGEHDWNPANILKSSKTQRPVKIDNGLLMYNGELISGSGFSNDFLRIFLASEKDIFRSYINASRRLNSQLDLSSREAVSQTYLEGIDDYLLEKIKEQISKNPSKKKYFMDFMMGLKDAIALANDNDFLDKFTKKYADEGYGQEASDSVRALKENAKKSQKLYEKFLEYYDELTSTTSKETTKLMALENKKEALLARISTLDRYEKLDDNLNRQLQLKIDSYSSRLAIETNERNRSWYQNKISQLRGLLKEGDGELKKYREKKQELRKELKEVETSIAREKLEQRQIAAAQRRMELKLAEETRRKQLPLAKVTIGGGLPATQTGAALTKKPIVASLAGTTKTVARPAVAARTRAAVAAPRAANPDRGAAVIGGGRPLGPGGKATVDVKPVAPGIKAIKPPKQEEASSPDSGVGSSGNSSYHESQASSMEAQTPPKQKEAPPSPIKKAIQTTLQSNKSFTQDFHRAVSKLKQMTLEQKTFEDFKESLTKKERKIIQKTVNATLPSSERCNVPESLNEGPSPANEIKLWKYLEKNKSSFISAASELSPTTSIAPKSATLTRQLPTTKVR